MGKAAAKIITTTQIDPVNAKVELAAAAFGAKQQFISATFNMGWRLAITVVVPIVVGVKIDDHFRTSPSFTLVGLMLAVVAGSAAVWTTVKQVNSQQASDAAEEASIIKRKAK